MSPSSDSDSDSHKGKYKSKDKKDKKKYKEGKDYYDSDEEKKDKKKHKEGGGYGYDSDEEKRKKKEKKKHEHDEHKGGDHVGFQPPGFGQHSAHHSSPDQHSSHGYMPTLSFPSPGVPPPSAPRFSHPEHGQTPVSVTHPPQHPPAYTPPSNIPPAGYRLPLTTTAPFPDPQQAGQPPCFDLDGSPVYFGSALFQSSVQPCKIVPNLHPPCRIPYANCEYEHNGRYDLLPFTPDTMELVRASYGQMPPGRRPVEGGYEDNGAKLYHAVATVNGVRVPGKAGEHLGGANVPFGGQEINISTEYEILCWR